ncbi:hypothetical protein GLOTRDRAFT_94185 [Gloeophyllum trabeum ATCC 11539]|uniref:Uncharacterized protein n=1 Tax=Gloeophyllum trabeum (strain ATCC 11539 / FP-39264 / Madison 617) TaxID=670483 RepID=S7RPI8_GLOTA|nr:uncharacterized protein GLOTRDRAFT_94185 [Gloeophyllum trabeum ATCC 11539]EPQ54774.1 hypothetical protein GLOTRDRAFT_94185 [Gloeophyllum trabeum ATCC 11539]
MERCPVEIIWSIVSLACTDGGATGCSLSLVSRGMARVSEPFRFQSVALSGYQQIDAFISTVLVPSRKHPAIKHLFLSDCRVEKTTQYGGSTALSLAIDALGFFDLLPKILRVISPSLETFSLISFDPGYHRLFWDTFYGVSFPALTDLTMRVSSKRPIVPLYSGSFPHIDDYPLDMPRLERLHLAFAADMLSGIYQFNAELSPQYPLLGVLSSLASGSSVRAIRLSDLSDASRVRAGASLAHVLGFQTAGMTYRHPAPSLDSQDPYPRLPRLRLSQPSQTRVVIRAGGDLKKQPLAAAQLDYLKGLRKETLLSGPECDVPDIRILGFGSPMGYADWKTEWEQRQGLCSFGRERLLYE